MGTTKQIVFHKNTLTDMNKLTTLYVNVPVGIENSEKILFCSCGHVTRNGIGDVYVNINVLPHKDFEVDGKNILYKKQITLRESLCGASLTFDYIDNKQYSLKYNTGDVISPNQTKTIPNMGIKGGNLFIIFDVKFPTTLPLSVVEQLNKLLV